MDSSKNNIGMSNSCITEQKIKMHWAWHKQWYVNSIQLALIGPTRKRANIIYLQCGICGKKKIRIRSGK